MSKDIKPPDHIIYVCTGKNCKKKGGKELRKFFKDIRKQCGSNVQVIKTGCTDNCKNAPVVSLQPENSWFAKTDEAKAMEICEKLRLKDSNGKSENSKFDSSQ